MSRILSCVVFILWIFFTLVAVKPKPDVISIDFTALAGGYANLLVGLGGFAITVLAVLLGLEALDAGRGGEKHTDAHQAAVRHVAISLAVASVTCFVGANMLTEVNAFGHSLEKRQIQARSEFTQHLVAAGHSPKAIAEKQIQLESDLTESFPPQTQPATKALGPTNSTHGVSTIDGILSSSVRRHFVLGSITAYLASFLLLQALSFLLLIRFPNHKKIDALQSIGVLGIGGMIYIKMIHTASYGMTGDAFGGSRLLILLLFIATAIGYGFALKKAQIRLEGAEFLRTYTPLAPYFVSLLTCLLCMMALAGTFNNLGPITGGDRFLAFVLPTIATAMLLVLQLSRPTLQMLGAAQNSSPVLEGETGSEA